MSEPLLHALEAGERALDAGELSTAATHFSTALALVPGDVGLSLALANVHRLNDDPTAQRTVLLNAYRSGDWSAPNVAHPLGAALLEIGAAVEAEACFARVYAAHPRDPAAIAALAAAKRARGEATAAWPLIKQALALAPREPAYHLTAAQVRHELGDLLGALKWLDKAESLRANHGPTRVQRAYTSLMRGPSADGWAHFEFRPLPTPGTSARAWDGDALRGRSILISAEQGIGDQFQFLRFVERLAPAGAGRVVVECHPHLIDLLRGNGFDVVARGDVPDTDLHVPLLSLPHRLGLGDKVDGASVPYLRAIEAQAPPLPAADGRPRIGLVWAGNPAFPGRLLRDLDPSLLPELLSIDHVQWISLQQGEAGNVDFPGLHRLPALASWAATATLLSQLDALVTTDTGIAHLAGAMGVRTYVMLQKVPDWRWGMGGETCAWYPSLTLVRQAAPGNWQSAVRTIRNSLIT